MCRLRPSRETSSALSMRSANRPRRSAILDATQQQYFRGLINKNYMILVLKPNIDEKTSEYQRIEAHLKNFQNIEILVHNFQGTEKLLTELHLIGNTAALSVDELKSFPGVEHVIRVSEVYRVLGRHKDDHRPNNFTYNDVKFSQDNLNV